MTFRDAFKNSVDAARHASNKAVEDQIAHNPTRLTVEAFLSAMAEQGFGLVPKEASLDMIGAGIRAGVDYVWNGAPDHQTVGEARPQLTQRIYAAMVSDAQSRA